MPNDDTPLRCSLQSEVPVEIELGAGTAVVVRGECEFAATRLELEFGGARTTVEVAGLAGSSPSLAAWATVLPLPGTLEPGTHELSLKAMVEGQVRRGRLARIKLSAHRRPASPPSWRPKPTEPLVAICMATWEPDPARLRRQLDSIRAQQGVSWMCVISDDHTSAAGQGVLAEAIGDDPRFLLSSAPRRLGFYGNFERALRMMPAEVSYCALADQDDIWHPQKLAVLVAGIETDTRSQLAFSDFRLVTDGGEVVSRTYWTARKPNVSSLTSMLVVNQVTGAASILRRELVERALPFPPDPGGAYHDHWLALCAIVSGGITYIPGRTYDHVRYEDAVTVSAQGRGAAALPPGRARQASARLRSAFAGSLGTRNPDAGAAGFDRLLLILQLARVLELRLGSDLDPRHQRELARLRSVFTSPRGALRLLTRGFRPWVGRTETMGREHFLLGGLLWRRAVSRRARRERP